ncbi:MAG: DegT/DnrJ/EryC1/StrS family aminotransferase [Planctomycetaceae bacterium]|nr:DegT/DnrJ/EryC1/StrS family aminotransferase [Planctomycetaceae bacterium]
MWIRKRIDLTLRDLGHAFGCALKRRVTASSTTPVNANQTRAATNSPDLLPVLSVRSGFDLLIKASNWKPGDEILMSGLTIPDMPRIVREHGLVPVGLEVPPDILCPSVSEVAGKITPKTRALVIAHLFGGLCDLTPFRSLCDAHGICLIEDCAQSWIGHDHTAPSLADVSMFSFGTIKTGTALGGGLMRVHDAALLHRMRTLHAEWPVQSRWDYLRRVVRHGVLMALSGRIPIRLLAGAAKLFGTTHDSFVAAASRAYPGPDFFLRIRRQPNAALLAMMDFRLAQNLSASIQRRTMRGTQAAKHLAQSFTVLGNAAVRPTWWILAVLSNHPDELVKTLWSAGFDATRSSSLRPVGDLPATTRMMEQMVILPFDNRMPDAELDRMVMLVQQLKP